ncbi:four helix bundle protein [Belliella aquatica]|uniref:Four helix bundle protein n=1 Tax=Belliella aquatica TaxID=1323734 RepID=A0ABQ1MAD0_9BACT|nr:four helix bundle protein [Belliella aquatica]MCH7405700.1 four helix bundle protein [Belliella aquatica]GGC37125.1 four helix bundle protein [Belliella aquatica]
MVINSFEDLEIWKLARELAKYVRLNATNQTFNNDFRFVSQINSAAGSIMDNIAEGFERDGNREFIQFLYIAKGSCGEVRSQSYRAYDAGFIENETFDTVLKMTEKLKYKINGLITKLKNSGGKGYK